MPNAIRGRVLSGFIRLLSLALLLEICAADAVVDFSLYPQNAQSCLYSAQTATKCDSSTVPKFNACVCGNGNGFLDNAAKCIGSSDSGDLSSTYAVLSSNCATSNTPVSVSLDSWLSKASASTASASASTKTVQSVTTVTQSGSTKVSTQLSTLVTSVAASPIISTLVLQSTNNAGATIPVTSVLTFAPIQTGSGTSGSTSSSSAAATNASHGLSQGAVIGIGVGVGVPIAAALFGLVGVLIWRGKKKDKRATIDGSTLGFPPSNGTRPESMATLQADGMSPYMAHQGTSPAQAHYKHSSAQFSPPMQYAQNTQYNPAGQNMPYNYSQVPMSEGAYGIPPPANNAVEAPGSEVPRPQELPTQHY
ncbi:hypothetical protein BT63DRAFT_194863 [Microthyrium microscopicum]|uniref:Extracellular membrane protein CFEM domain-containing protein n=1 Tax=Microthyrium microscopicum TaxID=703497 RepID=A0A6A6ULP5_9PEZI|nr:hypothetical protein BT63DRAFT_194863 [Microthyrium microscopicum]